MHVCTVRIRALHEAPDHRVPVRDVSVRGVRLVLDQRVCHQADPGADASRHLPAPLHEHPRRYAQLEREKPP